MKKLIHVRGHFLWSWKRCYSVSELNSCVASRKPLINEANQKKNRLQFAREHKDWTVERWKKKVMWSDESRFTLLQSDGGIRAYSKMTIPGFMGLKL